MLVPTGDRILVRPTEVATISPGGIILPPQAQQKSQTGVVLAVGPGRIESGERVPIDVQVGAVVVFSKYGGTEVTEEDDLLLILSVQDVLAVNV